MLPGPYLTHKWHQTHLQLQLWEQSFWTHNLSSQRTRREPVLIFNQHSLIIIVVIMKEPAKNPWFFHENGRFIEFLELARTGGVLQFAIFQRTRTGTNSITRTTFIHICCHWSFPARSLLGAEYWNLEKSLKNSVKVLCMAWQRMLQSYQHKSSLIYTEKIWWLFLYYWTGPGGPIPPGNVPIPVCQEGMHPALYSRTSITKLATQKITTYPVLGLFQNSYANSVASSNISESISLQSDTIAKLAFF